MCGKQKQPRDESYDALLRQLVVRLESAEEAFRCDAGGVAGSEGDSVSAQPIHPTVMVVGLPRSGSTLLTQILAKSQVFAYPTNILARFYSCLGVGARVQKLLKPVLPQVEVGFESNFGKTDAWLEPNEFGFFWEHHFPFEEHHEPDETQLLALPKGRFASEIAALQHEENRPACFKALHINYILPWVANVLPGAIFVRMKRSPQFVALSLLEGRRHRYGTMDRWISCKPANWEGLTRLSPAEQVAAQVSSIEKALDHAQNLLPDRFVTVEYQDLCLAPEKVVGWINEALVRTGHEFVSANVPSDLSFAPRYDVDTTPELANEVARALAEHGLEG